MERQVSVEGLRFCLKCRLGPLSLSSDSIKGGKMCGICTSDFKLVTMSIDCHTGRPIRNLARRKAIAAFGLTQNLLQVNLLHDGAIFLHLITFFFSVYSYGRQPRGAAKVNDFLTTLNLKLIPLRKPANMEQQECVASEELAKEMTHKAA